MDFDLDISGTGHGERTVFFLMMLKSLTIYVGGGGMKLHLKGSNLIGKQACEI